MSAVWPESLLTLMPKKYILPHNSATSFDSPARLYIMQQNKQTSAIAHVFKYTCTQSFVTEQFHENHRIIYRFFQNTAKDSQWYNVCYKVYISVFT